MAELIVSEITKKFDEKTVIEKISLQLFHNELVSLLGRSGAGKTTLFHVIAGLLKPDRGEIFLDGELLTKPGNISYMLQKDLLLSHKTIEDNVALPLVIQGIKKAKSREMVRPYFESFSLSGTEKQYPAQLSGGMRQRAALLRTYLFSAKAALLDEPFSALDTITKSKMHCWYLEIMEKFPISTLFITHDIDEAIVLSDRIYLMTGVPGRITKEIKIEEPKPRKKEFPLTESFLRYKKDIIMHLEESSLYFKD